MTQVQTLRATKKRKATYLVRQEEKKALQDEIHELQQQLQALQTHEHGGEAQRRALYASLGFNVELKETVDHQHIRVAGVQSLVSEWLQKQSNSPMGMKIHLGRDWNERRETLVGMKDERLARGFRYVMARCQHLALFKPQCAEERFEDEDGNFCCVRNEVIPFPGVQSLKKVFDAVMFTVDTLEISISEQLGHMTLRDDYDVMDAGAFISNSRLASGLDCGVTTELNAVAFGQYVEKAGEQPYGIMAIDSVDEDELHPYHPKECVRKVLNGTVVLLPVTRKKKNRSDAKTETKFAERGNVKQANGNAENEDEVLIVMIRSVFVKTCRPEFEISELAVQELRETITRWGDVVLQAIRRIIYS